MGPVIPLANTCRMMLTMTPTTPATIPTLIHFLHIAIKIEKESMV
jgi:hypothetical protein